jgi:hypothetical protein
MRNAERRLQQLEHAAKPRTRQIRIVWDTQPLPQQDVELLNERGEAEEDIILIRVCYETRAPIKEAGTSPAAPPVP